MLRKLLKPKEALESFDKVLAMDADGKDGSAHNHRGSALAALGHLAEATVAFRRAVAVNPSNAKYQADLDQHLHKMGGHGPAPSASVSAPESAQNQPEKPRQAQ